MGVWHGVGPCAVGGRGMASLRPSACEMSDDITIACAIGIECWSGARSVRRVRGQGRVSDDEGALRA